MDLRVVQKQRGKMKEAMGSKELSVSPGPSYEARNAYWTPQPSSTQSSTSEVTERSPEPVLRWDTDGQHIGTAVDVASSISRGTNNSSIKLTPPTWTGLEQVQRSQEQFSPTDWRRYLRQDNGAVLKETGVTKDIRSASSIASTVPSTPVVAPAPAESGAGLQKRRADERGCGGESQLLPVSFAVTEKLEQKYDFRNLDRELEVARKLRENTTKLYGAMYRTRIENGISIENVASPVAKQEKQEKQEEKTPWSSDETVLAAVKALVTGKVNKAKILLNGMGSQETSSHLIHGMNQTDHVISLATEKIQGVEDETGPKNAVKARLVAMDPSLAVVTDAMRIEIGPSESAIPAPGELERLFEKKTESERRERNLTAALDQRLKGSLSSDVDLERLFEAREENARRTRMMEVRFEEK